MNTIKEIFIKSKLYWVCISITTILGYGFTLTNHAIGMDDFNFAGYFKQNGFLEQGRFGPNLINTIFDMTDFLPVWNDLIATLLMIGGILIWCYFFHQISNGLFDEKASIIFSCVMISCPLFAEIFVIMSATTISSFTVIFSGIAVLLFYKGVFCSNRTPIKVRYIILASLFLAIGMGFYEYCFIYFLSGAFMGLLLAMIADQSCNKTFSIKNLLLLALQLAVVVVGSLVLNKVLLKVFFYIEGIQRSNEYLSAYMQYPKEGFFEYFINFLKSLVGYFAKGGVGNTPFTIYLFDASAILIVLTSFLFAVKKKNIFIAFVGLGTILSALALFFITGFVYMPPRVLVTFSMFIAFGVALFYIVSVKSGFIKNVKVNTVCKLTSYLLTLIVVFYGTKGLNQYFYADYEVYQRDLQYAHQIDYKIKETVGAQIAKPVIFIGMPSFRPIEPAVTVQSLFAFERLRNFNMDNSEVTHGFMKMIGYDYNSSYTKPEQVEQAKLEAQSMPVFPLDGSVKEFDDFIVTKLGVAIVEKLEQSKEQFYENDNTNSLDVVGNMAIEIYNQTDTALEMKGWGILQDKNTKSSIIRVALIADTQQYLLETLQQERLDVSSYLQKNYDYSGFSLPTTSLSSFENGTYEVAILIENGSYKKIMPTDKIITIQN